MKIGIILDELSLDFKIALKMVKLARIDWIELRVIDGKNVAQIDFSRLKEYAEVLKKENIKVCAIASPLLKCYLPGEEGLVAPGDQFGFRVDDYQSHLKLIDKMFQTADLFGTNLLRIFSFWKVGPLDETKASLISSYLKPFVEKASEMGFTLMLENEPSCYVRTLSEAKKIVKAIGSKNLKILWDPGNAKLCGEDEREAEVDSDIVHVHLKNFVEKNGKTVFTNPLSGEVDIQVVLNRLWSIDYEGFLVLEPCTGGMSLSDFDLTVRALKSLLKG